MPSLLREPPTVGEAHGLPPLWRRFVGPTGDTLRGVLALRSGAVRRATGTGAASVSSAVPDAVHARMAEYHRLGRQQRQWAPQLTRLVQRTVATLLQSGAAPVAPGDVGGGVAALLPATFADLSTARPALPAVLAEDPDVESPQPAPELAGGARWHLEHECWQRLDHVHDRWWRYATQAGDDAAPEAVGQERYVAVMARVGRACTHFEDGGTGSGPGRRAPPPPGLRRPMAGLVVGLPGAEAALQDPDTAPAVAWTAVVQKDFFDDMGGRAVARGLPRRDFLFGTLASVSHAWAPRGALSTQLTLVRHDAEFLAGLLDVVLGMEESAAPPRSPSPAAKLLRRASPVPDKPPLPRCGLLGAAAHGAILKEAPPHMSALLRRRAATPTLPAITAAPSALDGTGALKGKLLSSCVVLPPQASTSDGLVVRPTRQAEHYHWAAKRRAASPGAEQSLPDLDTGAFFALLDGYRSALQIVVKLFARPQTPARGATSVCQAVGVVSDLALEMVLPVPGTALRLRRGLSEIGGIRTTAGLRQAVFDLCEMERRGLRDIFAKTGRMVLDPAVTMVHHSVTVVLNGFVEPDDRP